MLNVTGVMTLQKVINESVQTKDGRSFQKVELHGFVETGWTGQGMKAALPVSVSPNKRALESLGELSMLPPGSKVTIEGYVKGNAYQDKVYTSIVATKAEISNMGMHYAPVQQQPQQQVMQQPPGLDDIPF